MQINLHRVQQPVYYHHNRNTFSPQKQLSRRAPQNNKQSPITIPIIINTTNSSALNVINQILQQQLKHGEKIKELTYQGIATPQAKKALANIDQELKLISHQIAEIDIHFIKHPQQASIEAVNTLALVSAVARANQTTIKQHSTDTLVLSLIKTSLDQQMEINSLAITSQKQFKTLQNIEHDINAMFLQIEEIKHTKADNNNYHQKTEENVKLLSEILQNNRNSLLSCKQENKTNMDNATTTATTFKPQLRGVGKMVYSINHPLKTPLALNGAALIPAPILETNAPKVTANAIALKQSAIDIEQDIEMQIQDVKRKWQTEENDQVTERARLPKIVRDLSKISDGAIRDDLALYQPLWNKVWRENIREIFEI